MPPQTIISDPVQTALVKFLRQPGAPNWIELVTPNGPQSKLTAALKKGGGQHHLCYEVSDMARACDHLRDQQMLVAEYAYKSGRRTNARRSKSTIHRLPGQ